MAANMTSNTAIRIITGSNKIILMMAAKQLNKMHLLTQSLFTNNNGPRCLWSLLNTFRIRRRRFRGLSWKLNSGNGCIKSLVKNMGDVPEGLRPRQKPL